LALAHIGLNEMMQAKARFSELCDLDSDYDLDPLQFAPKVLTLFSEARNEKVQAKCQAVCDEATKLLNEANAPALLKLIQSSAESCPCLLALAKDAAELFYRDGLDAYKRGDFSQALQSFKTALSFNSQHELATQYIDLTQTKVQLAVDRLVLEWRKHFDAREFAQAIASYRQLESANLADKGTAAIDQIRTEYRKSVSAIADGWRRSCSDRQAVTPDAAREQATLMLPDLSIARDILAQIGSCASTSPPPAAAASTEPCLQMATQLAMVRIKTRVDPEIPRAAKPATPVRIVMKVKIDEAGNVAVKDVQGANNFLNSRVKTAVEQWKFIPAVVAGKARCVDTELPIVLN
jgi:tetratricopeptide (TPR) repeat protein